MLSVDNITVSFSGHDLFSDVSFLINPRDRIGLVGKNGAGKSTLLKIINGLQIPTSGKVSRTGECRIGYLPQVMNVADDTTLIAECNKAFSEFLEIEERIERLNKEICERTDYDSPEYEKLLIELHEKTEFFHTHGGGERDGDIERMLVGLGFRREDFGKMTAEFSGGWRMRIELAKMLLSQPTLLLLDEPTNHLDIESIQWLEDYLTNFTGGVVLISHDKAFLDNVTNRTVELTTGKAVDYKVPYSQYIVLRAERRVQQQAAYENPQTLIEKTEDFIERFRYKPSKSNQVQSRVKQLEKLDRLEIEQEDIARMNIRFPPAPRAGQVVVEAKEAGHSYDAQRVIFSGCDLVVERGEKIALVGRNGEGKSTFIKAMLGEFEASQGTIKTGYNVNVGYFAQNQDDLMDGDFTVYDTLDKVAVGDIRTRLRDILAAFLFRGEDIDKKVKVLSGGERSRLAMARLMLEPYNLLVLDEPTNHMDMLSKEILKQALQNYDGTVVVISHDREFLDGLVQTVYEFRDGRVRQYMGGIYDFINSRKIEDVRDIERREKPAPKVEKPVETPAEKPAPKQRKNSFRIKEVEKKIEETEGVVSALETDLADPSKYSQEVLEKWQAQKAILDGLMEEWAQLSD